jgi:hypothetical protein
MRVFFHGASVTAQGGETSYFHWLTARYQGRTDTSLVKMGYGGTHLNDAGFLNLTSDTAGDYDLCVLDWNDTALSSFDEAKLRQMAGGLLERGIVPVFVILYTYNQQREGRQSETQVKTLCEAYELECWDLREHVEPDRHTRDGVHTTLEGAQLYARLISERLEQIRPKLSKYREVQIEFDPIAVDLWNGELSEIPEGYRLVIDIDAIGPSPQVIAEVLLGPSAPIIDVDSGRFRISVWDRWCHYDRKGYVTIWRAREASRHSVNVQVLSDAIDYSICTRPFDFTGTKLFRPKALYGVNCRILDVRMFPPLTADAAVDASETDL